MALSPAQLETLKAEVDAAVETAANIAEVIAPEFTGYIVLGKALAHIAPDLYNDVLLIVQQDEPDDAANAALAAKIAALANPGEL